MSNWNALPPPLPPPPRISRSRSPSRTSYGQRGPYPDAPHPQDPYRAEWEAYNRDRAWVDWERDRAAYEHSRRGRSRSPPFDEGGRKRRRSISPYERERYEPRPRYNDDYDAHSRNYGYMSPRSRSFSYSRTSRGPPDPHSLEYPATLKQYAEWFRFFYPQQANEEDIADKAAEQESGDGSKPRNGIKARWEKYKKDFMANQLQVLFDHHKKSPWFSEKYDPSPEFVKLRTKVRKIGWKGRINQFLTDVEVGKYDISANEPEMQPTSPISQLKEGKEERENADGNNADSSATDVKPELKKDDDDFVVDPEDDNVDNDVSKLDANGKTGIDGVRALRPDEVSVLPEGNQVMIRTIPPDIGRVKLEAAMKDIPGLIYLALGDPLQKRNYYRAGWIKFEDGVDIPTVISALSEKKIEGFKLHVSHNTRPFISRTRQTPEVASKPERIAKDLEQAKRLAILLEDEYEKIRLFKPEPSNKESDALRQDGEPAQVEVDTMIIDSRFDEIDEPRERGSDAVERRIERLVQDFPSPTEDSEKSMQDNKNAIALDTYLAYLRAAFNACYYCACVCDHAEELQRKCLKHVRKPLSRPSAKETVVGDQKKDDGRENKDNQSKEKAAEGKEWKRNDDRWLDWLDAKIAVLIDRDGVDVHNYGGKDYAEELSKAVEPHIKQEDEGKFRCKTCQKLFKATSFVEKHIANKHSELVRQLDDIPYFNNFALDPQRIQPLTHPPSGGNNIGQAPPPQAYGLSGPPPYDHTRPSYYGGFPPPPSYPPFNNGGQWDQHYPSYGGYPLPPPGPLPVRSLRDEPPLSSGSRRLSDRISGFAPIHDSANHGHGIEGLPPKPIVSHDHEQRGRRGGRTSGPPPPPPPDAKEDPRAAAGKRVSYHDMDLVAEGDIELTY